MFAKNLDGTGEFLCPCGNLLQHWKNFSGQTISFCSVLYCWESATVAAHVQKFYDEDQEGFVIPVCKKHSTVTNSALEIDNDVNLVPADVKKTCRKEKSDLDWILG